MTDGDIRAIVREVLAARGIRPPADTPAQVPGRLRLTMVAPTPPGSPCLIEPAVGCNQCGYCVSLGH